jgi:hypothetical protein
LSRFATAAAAVALFAGCGSTPELPDPDRAVALPAYPRASGLIEFTVSPGTMRFFVDAPSLSVAEKEGVVRYTLVARSPENAENVSYEALSCLTGQYRVQAVGRTDRTWAARGGEWRAVSDTWRRALYKEYFCPQNELIHSAAEGVRALQQGGHPFSRGFGAPGPTTPR